MVENNQDLSGIEQLYGKKLDAEQLREAEENLLGFVELILEADEENQRERAAMKE